MSHRIAQMRARFRLARGRCPACCSEAPEGCGVCLGYQGPHPMDATTLRRWARRFETRLWAEPQQKSPTWQPVAETMGRTA